MDTQKLTLLLDKSAPFDGTKVAILDEVTACTLSSDPQKVLW